MRLPTSPPLKTQEAVRLRAVVLGAVQGVGFRPFVFHLATALKLTGWVRNTAQGVVIEAEGLPGVLREFLLRLETEKPDVAIIHSIEPTFLDAIGHEDFAIRESDLGGAATAFILPDLATCAACRAEVFDPANRRHRYPFTNCTHCGPRFSIIESLPYDRTRTSMKRFAMCPLCQTEYDDPANRRFHAQPNACPNCGPQLALWNADGEVLAGGDESLKIAANALRDGQIVALKGLGGFQLLVDARDEAAVRRLRQRKHREEKPFAVMFANVADIRSHCEVDELEERLLHSPQAPIVLLRKFRCSLSSSVAPGNPWLGVMLPCTPLHHLLLHDLNFPVVATSGNLSDEPICTEEHEALARLGGVADLFLVHDRPIVRHVDDSVARVLLGREMVLRRARGSAPLPVEVKETERPILAVGAHQKNSIALAVGGQAFLSQHIGDLETESALSAFQSVITDFERLYQAAPAVVACDGHPDFHATRHAKSRGLPVVEVQHHHAHVLSCMADNGLSGPVLGVAWDGTGYGTDGTVWGGEFFLMRSARVPSGQDGMRNAIDRVAHLRTFRMPGGESAVREPRRCALGLLYEIFGDAGFQRDDLPPVQEISATELDVLRVMLNRKLNAPVTSSAGRLFDAVASLCGVRQAAGFEGQAAMVLEFLADSFTSEENYPFAVAGDNPMVADWEPMILEIIADLKNELPIARIAAKFHNTLAEIIVQVARRANEERVVLSGGCFQNAVLLTKAVTRLRSAGFRPYWHQRVPPNDGGIALGQIVAAANLLA